MDWLRRARADSSSTASSYPSLDEGRGGTSVGDECSRWVHAQGCVASKDQNGGQVHSCGSSLECRGRDGLRESADGAEEIVRGGWSEMKEDGMDQEGEAPSTGSTSGRTSGRVETSSSDEAAESVTRRDGDAEDDEYDCDDSSDGDESIIYDPKKRWVRASPGNAEPSRTVSEFVDADSSATRHLDREAAEEFHAEENIESVREQDATSSKGEVSNQDCSGSANGKATYSAHKSFDRKLAMTRFAVARPNELIRKESILKRLPRAIRHRILTHLLKSPVPIIPTDNNTLHPRHRIHPSILQTCHQFYAEGKAILYHENTFRFATHISLMHWLLPSTSTTTPLAPTHHQIQHIELTAYAFVWFTACLSAGPPPHLSWNQPFLVPSWPFNKQEFRRVAWDLSGIETLTIDFWVTERRWDEIFDAFLPRSGLYVLRNSGFRPKEVRVRTYGEIFEFTARQIVRALMGREEGEGRRWIV